MTQRARIILVDDHEGLREILAEYLARSGAFEVVGQFANGTDALDAVHRVVPDIVVLDIDMPGKTAFAIAAEISAERPTTKVVFLSGYCNDRYIRDAIAAHAAGYVTKNEPAARIIEALSKVAGGGTYFSPQVRERLVIDERGVRLAHVNSTRSALLTDREIEVLRHVARGQSKRDIAKILFLSPRTVERHVANTMAKLDIHDRVELTRFAIREGVVEA